MSNQILARVVRLLDEGLVVPAPSLMKLRYPDSTERVWGQSQQSLADVGIGPQEAKLTDNETLIRNGMRSLEIKGEPPSSQMVLLLQEILPLVKEKILCVAVNKLSGVPVLSHMPTIRGDMLVGDVKQVYMFGLGKTNPKDVQIVPAALAGWVSAEPMEDHQPVGLHGEEVHVIALSR